MSKERLEEIKNGTYLYFRKHNELKEDMDWLIEQAERVQELESESYNAHLERLLDRREKQNKRYREALEFYSDIELYDEYDHPELGLTTDVNIDKGKKARKALEG